jgi:hypothetical protein
MPQAPLCTYSHEGTLKRRPKNLSETASVRHEGSVCAVNTEKQSSQPNLGDIHKNAALQAEASVPLLP